METITFKELLSDNNPFAIRHILVPKIQRAYAQGRTDARTSKTRDRFLKSIFAKISNDKTLTLDFIYGHIDNGCLIPLDGQQRLTTLWLLHWYASRKEGINTEILDKFSYNTRYSARDFMKRLSAYTPTWHGKLSEEIQNEGWFPMDWANDPSVSGMFVTLDAINDLFSNIENLWEKLDLINFYFLPLEQLDLTDEIYIKMNSRGKPLTDFEHFKAEFLKVIRNIGCNEDSESGDAIAKRIGHKIDIDWTDLLWDYRGEDNLIDDEFLRYFRIICHLITYRDGRSFNDEISGLDDFQLINEFFTGEQAYRNILYLESLFDCWVDINKSKTTDEDDSATGIEAFFKDYLSLRHEEGKSVPMGDRLDLFGAGLRSYPNFRNPNVLQWLTTLFAFITFITNRDKVCDEDFRRRLRIVINLQKNSSNEIVDTPKGDAGNRMPAILLHVQNIILEGNVEQKIMVDGKERPTFNVSQINEEIQKLDFTKQNPEQAEPLFKLEDHPLLRGKVLAVGWTNTHLYQKFTDLFCNCSRDAIDCAMLAVTDYSQRRSNQVIQLGSGDEGNMGEDAWHDLFHPTEKTKNFEATSEALRAVLEQFDEFNDDALYEFATRYEEECRDMGIFDWRYYYLHYEVFRAFRYGKYTMWENLPYELVAIYARKYESNNAYQCFLAELSEDEDLEQIDEIRWLIYKNGWLTCLNDRFQYREGENAETVVSELIIPQKDGIDTVDRIEYFRANPL